MADCQTKWRKLADPPFGWQKGMTFPALPVSECIDLRGEVAAVQEGSDAVVGEVAESQGVAAEGFEAAVDGFGGSVGGVVVEVGQHVGAAPMQGASELGQFLQAWG